METTMKSYVKYIVITTTKKYKHFILILFIFIFYNCLNINLLKIKMFKLKYYYSMLLIYLVRKMFILQQICKKQIYCITFLIFVIPVET